MNMMAATLTALSLAALCSVPADTQQRSTTYQSVAGTTYAPRMVIAQGDIRIPTDAQFERMEERAITTPPLDVRERRPASAAEKRPRSGRWMSEPTASTSSSWGAAQSAPIASEPKGALPPLPLDPRRFLWMALGALLFALTLQTASAEREENR